MTNQKAVQQGTFKEKCEYYEENIKNTHTSYSTNYNNF